MKKELLLTQMIGELKTDFDLLNNSDLNGFQLDPPMTSNCTMDCLLEFHEVDEIHNQLHF